MFKFFLTAIIVAIGANVSAGEVNFQKGLESTSLVVGQSYSIDRQDAIKVVAFALKEGDKVSVCGVYWIEDNISSYVTAAKQILRATGFSIGSRQLNVSGSHFNRITGKSELKESKAKCRQTRVPWNNALMNKELNIKTRGNTVRF